MDDSPASDPSPTSSDGPTGASANAWSERGRADAAAGAPRDAAEQRIQAEGAAARVDEDLEAVRKDLDDIHKRIDRVRALREEAAGASTDLKHMEQEREDARQRKADLETSIEAVEEEQSAKKARGSALYATLYTLAGIFFVAGDVIMSREIVANALKLRGDVEPWIFAIGLAMLAVLLKPAYDRLVEKRYWNGAPAAFTGVIGVCAVGAISTLWILGAFRSTAFVNNTKVQRLSGELMQTSDPARIGEIQSEIVALQQGLIESPLGYWAFVLSGVLFAIAGAVCLGIGFQHGRDAYHLRYRLHRARTRLLDEFDALTETLDRLDDAIPETRTRLARLRQRLADRDGLDALRDRRDALDDRVTALMDERAGLRTEQRRAAYRSGYAETAPSASAPRGDGAPSVRLHEASSNGTANRPHEALRAMIRGRE